MLLCQRDSILCEVQMTICTFNTFSPLYGWVPAGPYEVTSTAVTMMHLPLIQWLRELPGTRVHLRKSAVDTGVVFGHGLLHYQSTIVRMKKPLPHRQRRWYSGFGELRQSERREWCYVIMLTLELCRSLPVASLDRAQRLEAQHGNNPGKDQFAMATCRLPSDWRSDEINCTTVDNRVGY